MRPLPTRRVVIDGRWIRIDSGIGHYTYWLARTLPAVAEDLDIQVLLPDRDDPLVAELEANPGGLATSRFRASPWAPAGVGAAALHLLRRAPVLYHAPDWFGLPGVPLQWRTVLTIHDLIPLLAPHWIPNSMKARQPRLYRWTLRAMTRGAARIITDANLTKEQIIRLLGVPPERIHVVPLGVTRPTEVPASRAREMLHRFGLQEADFLLSVGRPAPYKGFAHLVQAFAAVRRSEKLVIVGAFDPRYEEAARETRRLGLTDSVVFTGPVASEVLEVLYQQARAFATLSRLEGFGLPPLEAMARGIPVLATSIDIFRQTLGEAALLVDPDDPEAIRSGLWRVLHDAPLREQLVREGLKRVSGLSWEACARSTAEVYRLAITTGTAR